MKEIHNGKIAIVSCDLPERKRPCLCVFEGNTLTKYASFNNQESADEFMEILKEFCEAKGEQ